MYYKKAQPDKFYPLDARLALAAEAAAGRLLQTVLYAGAATSGEELV